MNKLIAALIFFVLFASAAYSQSVKTLTLYDAINLAKRNNSDYVIAKLDKLKADKQVSEVYSENLVPSLTLSSRYTRSFRKQTITIFGQNFEIGSDNSITTTLDVSEPIPFLGTPVFNGIRIAEYYSRIQDENVKSVEAKIKTDVKKSFFNVLLLKEVIKLNEQSIENASENLRVVEARYKAGVALEYDYIRAKVVMENQKPVLSQSKNNLAIAKKVLKNSIGLKDDSELDVIGDLTYDSTEVWGTTDELIKKISENNVAVRQLKLSKKINEQLVDVNYANYLPKFYVFGQWQSQANENDDRSISGYRFYNSIVAGIGLSWNLNLFRNSYKEQQSKIDVQRSEETIIKTKELLKTQTESTLLRIEDARNRIKSQSDLVGIAQRGYDLANISYKSGVLNQIDVVNAELGLNQVKLSYLQAIYDYLNARSDLEQLLEK
jgi:outer membrane protein TolC